MTAIAELRRRLSSARSADAQTAPPPPLDRSAYEEVATQLGPLWFDRRDEVMRPYVKRRHAWEESEGSLLRLLIKPGTRFLDVGANIGYFSVLAAQAASHVSVDAVEPHPESAAALRWNLSINRVSATVHQVALDERRRRLVLDVAPTNTGDARVSDRQPQPGAIQVDAVPADVLFAGRSFDVVKIDVQGWEPEVIRGMRQIIRRSRDIVIVAEFWPAALRDRGVEPGTVLQMYRALDLDVVAQVDSTLRRLNDDQITGICDDAGPYGQVNLLLRPVRGG
jgi:FkbM family methyltransferase